MISYNVQLFTHLCIGRPLLVEQFCNDASLEHIQMFLFRSWKVLVENMFAPTSAKETANLAK